MRKRTLTRARPPHLRLQPLESWGIHSGSSLSRPVHGALCGSSSWLRHASNILEVLTSALTGIAPMKDVLSSCAPPSPLILYTAEGKTDFQLGANPQPRKLNENNSTFKHFMISEVTLNSLKYSLHTYRKISDIWAKFLRTRSLGEKL